MLIVPLPLASSHTVPKLRTPWSTVPNRLPWASRVTGPKGKAPLAELKEARAWIVPLPLASSHTVPLLKAPPFCAMPYRLPAASAVRRPAGLTPLVLVKEARAWIVLLPLASSQITPPAGPPLWVVPYRLPLASRVTGPRGNAPLVVSNEARAVMVPLPLASSHTTPTLLAPPESAVPKRLPPASRVTPANGLVPLVPLKVASGVMVPLP